MPKENKHSRGRREEKKEKKRKREKGEDETNESSKRRRSEEADPAQDVEFTGLDNTEPLQDEQGTVSERPFYGMLEDKEQEIFRNADELLELNDFPSEEERALFLADVYRQADGKELKIACSQSCSRLMERLILMSTVEQKKKLFETFAGNFPHLIQHRFASHCCETLFIQSAPVVTQELTADSKKKTEAEGGEEEGKDVSMESLFLQTLDELEGQMTFLLTDRFASHTLRLLMVILSGRPLEKASTRSLLQSKKKEKIEVKHMDSAPTEFSLNKRSVPESFNFAVEKILSDTVATMDTSFIRILATHPTGNPTLQLLLELEFTNAKSKKGAENEKSIISALLPDDITTEGSDSSVFINGIIYDAIGSRLLETICAYAPGKLFKQIYNSTFKDRIAGLARNEISSYVVIRVLQRLSKEDLEEAVEQITPQIRGLVERSRTGIIKTLIERCRARGATKSVEALTQAIASAYDSDPATLVLKMACIDDIDALIKSTTAPEETLEDTSTEEGRRPKKSTPNTLKPTPQQTHGSLLAQSLLSIPGAPTTLLQSSLLAQSPATLLALSLYTPTSHILQSSLLPTPTNLLFRRKLTNALLFPQTSTTHNPNSDPILALALSPTGSHILDSILKSTSCSNGLFALTERIALCLTGYEFELRESSSGRFVWRNWMVDLFGRKRGEWVNKVKAMGAEYAPVEVVPELQAGGKEEKKGGRKDKNGGKGKGKGDKSGDGNGKGKSAIELARERFGAKKAEKTTGFKGKGGGQGTGANQVQKIGA